MELQGRKVLCVGLCCFDIVMVCKSYPEEDSDQRCVSQRWQRGGNASNNCSVFAEFGIPCEVLGTMSYDFGGEFMKKDLEKHHISYENCRFYENYESPMSVIWISAQNGSRTIVHSNKNMPEVTFEDFKSLDLTNYKWIHFECRPSTEEIVKMIKHINEWNSHFLNDRIKVSIEIEKSRTELIEMLGLCDVVFISKDFAKVCGYEDKESAVEGLSSKLKSSAIIICAWGEKGASSAESPFGLIHTSKAYPPNKIVDTLGAGDTFVAATIISLLKERTISEAIQMACKVAGTKCGINGIIGLGKLCPFL